ncbi:hypothetical protein [Ancylobacter sp. G4_0304]|uniref:tetratricopeptide repeat protein n=1 Tax=Ancylobacter sp. G4_0304 TaxID=3114289 RepID=UPI0039C5BB5A
MSLKRAALLVLLGGAVVPAIAQQIDLPGSSGSTPAAGSNTTARAARPKVDETALRYFASQGDTRRLEAEIGRLRALYPDWSPPADLFGPQTDTELEHMWKLYTDGKFSDVRSAIAARQAADPSWDPPADLIARLDESETRRRLINASDAGQWSTVLRLATDTPAVLTCQNIDLLWRVAEAFAKTEQMNRSIDAFTYILTNCNDTNERLATLQKAMPLLNDDQLKGLLALERKDADGKPEFASLRDELIRRRMGAAAANPEFTVPDDDIKRMETLSKQSDTPGDPLLLGWYLFRHDDATRSLEWFKLALDRKGGPKAAEGYVLALNFLGRALEAEPIAYEWKDSAPENNKAYLDVVISLLTADPPPVLDEIVLSRFSPVVVRDKYVPGAQGLGWYAYNTGQIPTAQAWFETALQWDPNDEPSAYGLALTYWRTQDMARLNTIVQTWGPRSERIVALVDPVVRARLEAQNLPNMALGSFTDPLVAAAARLTPPPMNTLGVMTPVQPAARGYVRTPTPQYVAPAPGVNPLAVPTTPVGPMSYAPTAQPRVGVQPFVQTPGLPNQGFVPVPTAANQPVVASGVQPVQRAYAAPAATQVDYQPQYTAPAPRRRAAAPRRAASSSVAASTGAAAGGSAGSAVARGWRLMDLNRPIEAVREFDYAIKYGSAKDAEDAAYGKSLAYLRKGMTNAAQIASLEAPQNPRRSMQLTGDLLAQQALVAYKDERYVEALIALDERSRIAPEQQDLMMLRAWAYYNINDTQSANRIFKALAAQGNMDAQEGVNAIIGRNRRLGYY